MAEQRDDHRLVALFGGGVEAATIPARSAGGAVRKKRTTARPTVRVDASGMETRV